MANFPPLYCSSAHSISVYTVYTLHFWNEWRRQKDKRRQILKISINFFFEKGQFSCKKREHFLLPFLWTDNPKWIKETVVKWCKIICLFAWKVKQFQSHCKMNTLCKCFVYQNSLPSLQNSSKPITLDIRISHICEYTVLFWRKKERK